MEPANKAQGLSEVGLKIPARFIAHTSLIIDAQESAVLSGVKRVAFPFLPVLFVGVLWGVHSPDGDSDVGARAPAKA